MVVGAGFCSDGVQDGEENIKMAERPDQILQKWEELKEAKQQGDQILKLFAKVERRGKPKSSSKPKKKKK